MALKTEAGQGGRVGHSNMTRYGKTKIVKEFSRRVRRINDKEAIRRGLARYPTNKEL